MLVQILRNTIAEGRAVFVDDIEDLEESEAKLLIRMGKAARHAGEVVEAEVLEDMTKEALLAKAADMKLENIKTSMTKASIIDAIKAAEEFGA